MSNPALVPVRFAEGSDDIIEGLAIPNGGPFAGNADIYRSRFDHADLCLDWFAERPVLFAHGKDAAVRSSVIGRVKTEDIRDITGKGKWIRAQLDKRHEYFEAIRALVKDGSLGWSHGTLSYLVESDPPARDGTVNITRWPVIEFTLTPVEANPYAVAHAARSADEAPALEFLGEAAEKLVADEPAEKPVRGIQTFGDIQAAATMSDELPDAFDTLSSAIYSAIYATDADFNPESPENKQAAIKTSLGQFETFVISIMDKASAAGRSAPVPIRAGKRNSTTDQDLIDQIHDRTVQLGASAHPDATDAQPNDDSPPAESEEDAARSGETVPRILVIREPADPAAVRAAIDESVTALARDAAAAFVRRPSTPIS